MNGTTYGDRLRSTERARASRARARGTVWAAACLFGLATAATAQQRPVVVLDPGHGGAEVGVRADALLEKDLILEISFVIGAEFVKRGFDVVYTRTRDEAVPWDRRRAIAEEVGAAALLMLHINGNEDRTRHGAEVYAFVDEARSAALAEQVAEALRASGSAAIVAPRDWPFLRSPAVPTAMIEVAFMTNPLEQRLLRSPTFQRELGAALASAVAAFAGAR